MAFESIPHVQDADHYLSIAIRRAIKKKSEASTGFQGKRSEKARHLLLVKLKALDQEIKSGLMGVAKSFPSIDGLNEFYSELFKNFIDMQRLKNALTSMSWTARKVSGIIGEEIRRLAKEKNADKDAINRMEKRAIGRAASLLRKVNNHLKFLEDARRQLRDFPTIKQLPTVCIAGLPNAGKSTLLSKLTTARPKIAAYEFTTKTLNLGYRKVGYEDIQFIDMPGELGRENHRNPIEAQAYLATKYLANVIVFVYDLDADAEKQESMLKNARGIHKPVIIYLSKTDIMDSARVREFKEAHAREELCYDTDALMDLIKKKL